MNAIRRAAGSTLMAAMLLAAIPVTAVAATVPGLAEVTVPVEDQSSEARSEALESALQEMLVRLAGSQDVLAEPASRDLLRNPARYVQQFRYESGSGSDAGLSLHASFDIDALERRLRERGLPVWGRERPRTLVLMAVDLPDGGRRVVADGTALADIWQESARRRGLPLEFPRMDSEDRGRIAASDIWGNFEEQLLAAADRYDPNAVLVVSSWSPGGNDWALRGNLLRDGERNERFELQQASLAAVVAAQVDSLAERYAREFAVAASGGGFSIGENLVAVEIRDVSAVDGYARVVDYLSGLSAVESLQVERVAPDRIHLAIKLRGSRAALEKAVALGRMLEPVRDVSTPDISLGEIGNMDGMDFSQPAGLVYRLRN